jgi:hypothetical protein
MSTQRKRESKGEGRCLVGSEQTVTEGKRRKEDVLDYK